MLASLKALVIASLLMSGLLCPSSVLMAAGSAGCGHAEADQAMLRTAAAGLMPCCLDSHRADSPVVQSDSPADAPAASLPAFGPVQDDSCQDSGCFGQRQKHRDKFEERNCGKRE